MGAFNWVESTTTVGELIKSLASTYTLAEQNGFSLAYPQSIGEITTKAILKTTATFGLDAYIKPERPADIYSYMLIAIGGELNSTSDDIDNVRSSVPARFAWYRQDNGIELYDWTAVQYWTSFSEDFINVVIQGDPGLDAAPYNSFLISYAYIGAVESFEGADVDHTYNFGLSVSSDIFEDVPETYGKRTASCVTDIGMMGTRTGTPFQAHLPKFSATAEHVDKNFITAGQWTHKFPFSDIVVYHAYDGDRGKLQNVLIGDRSAIFHPDILKYVEPDTEVEQQFQMFNINAPYSILNNGPNVYYGVALRRK